MGKIFAVLFVAFTGSEFWLSAFINLLVIAVISWLISAVIKVAEGSETAEQFFVIIMLLSGVGAVISLLILLLKFIF